MKRLSSPLLLLAPVAVLLCAGTGFAAETIRYYWAKDNEVKSAVIDVVIKDDLSEFRGTVRVAGRTRRLKIPAQHVIELWRGDSDAENQWTKGLARGRRLMAAKQYANVGVTSGAEEVFTGIAYSTEKGTPGQEKAEECYPWHNMYAVYYLIETRYLMGQDGTAAKYAEALKSVEEFRKRTEAKAKKKVSWQVPGPKGSTVTAEIHGWGPTRLSPLVTLYEARIHAAMGDKAKAVATFDQLIEKARKSQYSPILLADALKEKAAVEAEGLDSDKQEKIFRAAGNSMASLSKAIGSKDPFAETVLRRASNEAYLKGADLLFESALAQKVSFDLPHKRYTQLLEGEGKRDAALWFGAQAGIGACFVEKGQGENAYTALLEVVTRGGDHPAQMAEALYYIAKAAPLFADEIEKDGGSAEFLRIEAPRWLNDLKERYPTSKWAAKLTG